MDERPTPRVLVADDDPVSLEFLTSALRELGCAVVGAASGRATLAACAQSACDLLLLDRRMPGLGGAPLLRELHRAGCTAPAVATSAELDAPARAELAAAGYVDAVTKPIGMERLAMLLATHLPQWRGRRHGSGANVSAAALAASAEPALLEDGPALASVGGDGQTLRALRSLLAQELESVSARIAVLPAPELGDWLHRLRASCRYCGAMRLLDVAERLESELKRSGDAGRDELLAAVSATISALGKA
ncbi:MAG: response regulator [Rudaea sp.]|uniref:response regulator n=1 Tax=Rudaea sp. TaxID=2136325 RepID=UPI0039E5E512